MIGLEELRNAVQQELLSFKPEEDFDESSLEYLFELLQEDGVERTDVQELVNSIIEAEAPEDVINRIVALVQPNESNKTEPGVDVKVLTADQISKLNTLEEFNDDNIFKADPPLPLVDKSLSKKKNSKVPRTSEKNRKERDEHTAEMAALKAAKDGEFHTKRFEKYHKTWMGKDQWQRQEYSIVDSVEELDDDDYSSAWLECLRLGIPWGGRGAGGRGIQRVTGESLDVLIQNVTLGRDSVQLLNVATLKLNYGKRYCLTGRNGCGKTTLMRRIAMGSLPGFPPWLRVQYVEQELKGSNLTPVEYVIRYDFERTRLMKEEQEILEQLEVQEETSGTDLQLRLTEIYERLEQISAWDAESRAESKLRSVGFSDSLLAKTTQELSGGWRMRCALCGTLFMKPDVLLLDEPTNALDALGIEWLKRYLLDTTNFAGTVLLISHDRSFINAVTDELIVMRKKQLTYFPGSYDMYREMLKKKRDGLVNKIAAQEKRKEELRSYIEVQQKASKDRKSKGGDQKKQKQIRSKKKQIEKIDRIGLGRGDGKYFKQSYDGWYGVPSALDFDEKPLHFRFPESLVKSSSEQILLQLEDVSFGWSPDTPLITNFSAQVNGKDRIGIIGPNGVGKSTLLQVLIGDLAPIRGDFSINVSSGGMAVFHQDMATRLAQDQTPADLVLQLARGQGTVDCQTLEEARVYLGSFGLTGNLAMRPVSTLSGGEKSRVVFALESYKRPHLLVLDEPTAHLDLDSIDVLAAALNSFNGTSILISHDCAFLSETCTKLWVFDPTTKSILVPQPSANQTPGEFVSSTFQQFVSKNFNL